MWTPLTPGSISPTTKHIHDDHLDDDHVDDDHFDDHDIDDDHDSRLRRAPTRQRSPSIDCRLHALLDAIDAANELGSGRAVLRRLVERAIDNLDKAQLRATQGVRGGPRSGSGGRGAA